jgi:hypothetical protein
MLGRRYIEQFWKRAVEASGFVVLVALRSDRVVGFSSASIHGYDPRHGLGDVAPMCR